MEEEKRIQEEEANIEQMIAKTSNMNRRERRDREKFYLKEMKNHMKKRPTIKVDIDEEAAERQMHKARQWSTRYLILLKKLRELQDVNQENRRGLHKPNSGKDEVVEGGNQESIGGEVEDLSGMSDSNG